MRLLLDDGDEYGSMIESARAWMPPVCRENPQLAAGLQASSRRRGARLQARAQFGAGYILPAV
jgi:hypothetical protein